MCRAVCYSPPKYNKDFIQEFSDFLADFYICCPVDHFSTDYKSHLVSSDLTQFVEGPTHHLGHILDLTIANRLSVSLRKEGDRRFETAISNHLPIIFEARAPHSAKRLLALACQCQILTSCVSGEFFPASEDLKFFAMKELISPSCPENLPSSFHTTYSMTPILDSVAPLWLKSTKPRADSWLNDTRCALRQCCRQVAHSGRYRSYQQPSSHGVI